MLYSPNTRSLLHYFQAYHRGTRITAIKLVGKWSQILPLGQILRNPQPIVRHIIGRRY